MVAVSERWPEPDDAQGFGADACRAVTLADVEARALDHHRLGTEHLLLGLLADEAGPAAMALGGLGVTLNAARHKVDEAVVAPAIPPARRSAPLDRTARTARATRALARSVRFSHERGIQRVSSIHVLLGVLDVEGTAGQVLRGLGVDVRQLRARLDAVASGPTTEASGTSGSAVTIHEVRSAAIEGDVDDDGEKPTIYGPWCPACRHALDAGVTAWLVPARGTGTAPHVVLYACPGCGRGLGTGPA